MPVPGRAVEPCEGPSRTVRGEREPFDDGWGTLATSRSPRSRSPRDAGHRRAVCRSSPATIRPTSPSTRRSIPTAAASTAASTASAADAQLPEPVARARLRDPDRRQVNAAERLRGRSAPWLRAAPAQPRFGDRRLPAGRAVAGITRRVIEVLAEHAHPFSVVPESEVRHRARPRPHRPVRPRLAAAYVSVTTLGRRASRASWSRARCSRKRRLRTIATLARAPRRAGRCQRVAADPVRQRTELRSASSGSRAGRRDPRPSASCCARRGKSARCSSTGWRSIFERALARVMARVRDMRGGATTTPGFGARMRGGRGDGRPAAQRMDKACAVSD